MGYFFWEIFQTNQKTSFVNTESVAARDTIPLDHFIIPGIYWVLYPQIYSLWAVY